MQTALARGIGLEKHLPAIRDERALKTYDKVRRRMLALLSR